MPTTVIIEDEGVAARRLERMLVKRDVEVLTKLDSVQSAMQWLLKNPNPDLVFMDIQLGDGLSFELFEQELVNAPVIFTTAYDEYALNAFKVNSIDYLLKPIIEKELDFSLNKFKQQNTPKNLIGKDVLAYFKEHNTSNYKERYLVKVGTKLKSIPTQEIGLIYSFEKANYINVQGKNYVVDYSLDDFGNQLNPNQFFRISRKAWVNLNAIEEIQNHSGSRLQIKVTGSNDIFVVSRERVNEFKDWLDR